MSTASLKDMDSGSATAETRTLTSPASKAGSYKTGTQSTSDLDKVNEIENIDAEKAVTGAETTPPADEPQDGVLTGVRLFLVFLAMMFAVFVSHRLYVMHRSVALTHPDVRT